MRVWSEVLAAALAGDLPLAPVLVHGSPMQEWLRSNISRPWDVPALKRVVASSQVGDWKVQLKRQRGSTTFVYSDPARESPISAAPDRTVVTLREAIHLLWPSHIAAAHTDRERERFYLAVSFEELPEALTEPLLNFLPATCLPDPRLVTLHADDNYCRGLQSRMWFGSPGVTAALHYDDLNNLYMQAYGEKRFTLLPPSAHREMQVHPRWHQSTRQAQMRLHGKHRLDGDGAMQVHLRAGDLLFVPALWFHEVESVSENVAINVWTHSLAHDVWDALRVDDDPERWPLFAGSCSAALVGVAAASHAQIARLFACVRHRLGLLLVRLEQGQLWAAALLSERTRSLLGARYATDWLAADTLAGGGDDNVAEVARGAMLLKHLCDDALSDQVQQLASTVATSDPQPLDAAADALLLLDAPSRDLVLDDLVESAAAWSVGHAGISSGSLIKVFLDACLAGGGAHPRSESVS